MKFLEIKIPKSKLVLIPSWGGRSKKGKLSSEKINKLEEIGFKWTLKK